MCVHRESGAQRAVKVLRKSHMDDDEKRMLFNEINILKEIVSSQRSKVFPRIKLSSKDIQKVFLTKLFPLNTTNIPFMSAKGSP